MGVKPARLTTVALVQLAMALRPEVDSACQRLGYVRMDSLS
jgi:hypothetical protein